ncbi:MULTISPECIES: hypothetical protein [Legionella]|uniref:Uncharacterized protein n=1 Tax=Legionella maceachernii TaxID=466 RepID=A0A0W0W130_9GAMM|nr:hypothetical protein [Legionella maceachernii]KTD25622.1 hypothetical protein Lmac_1986 [Legionella maceachernii]SJZ57807.1 polymorphic outer membrane protein repeat-containing protein [Legionella maceachernii]SUP00654.1 Uncharacterised protein [Legionella maceachernii]
MQLLNLLPRLSLSLIIFGFLTLVQAAGSGFVDKLPNTAVCNQDNLSQCSQPSLPIINDYATTLYVNGNRPENGNGSSWLNAFNNLDSALEAAAIYPHPVEIWVATGVYKPSQVYAPQGVIGGAYGVNTPKLRTFNLPSDTAIFGGFSGNEISREERNGVLYPTILCGDMTSSCLTPYIPNSNNDRVWHVLTAGSDLFPGTGVKNVRLDNLIVRGGYANGPDNGILGAHNVLQSLSYEHAAGGGLLARYGSTIELNGMLFDQNSSDGSTATVSEILEGGLLVLASGGGAVAAIDPNSFISITKSRFTNNTALFPGGSGGALENLMGASYSISLSQFDQNSSSRNGGAIRSKDAGDINVLSCYFNNNVVGPVPDASGGAIGIINSNLSVYNSTFAENSTASTGFGGGAIFFHIPFNDGNPHFLNVTLSTFITNFAAAFGGGGINVFGILPNSGSQAMISNCEFTNNIGGVGGAIYLDSIATKITNSTFVANKAQVQGGAIFSSNFGNAIFNSAIPTLAQISNNRFLNNTIVGVPGGIFPPLAFFNFIANTFSHNASSVISMAPGGGAIAVEFLGNAQIFGNTFTQNIALSSPLEEYSRGGALLVGGGIGTPLIMNLAHACIASNLFSDNQANSDYNISVYNPANIPDGVTLSTCPFFAKK